MLKLVEGCGWLVKLSSSMTAMFIVKSPFAFKQGLNHIVGERKTHDEKFPYGVVSVIKECKAFLGTQVHLNAFK